MTFAEEDSATDSLDEDGAALSPNDKFTTVDELSEDSATFHTAGGFSSVHAIRPITAPATEQTTTDFNSFFIINIPRSKAFNLSL